MEIKEYLQNQLKKVFNQLGYEIEPSINFSARPELCDFQNNDAFQLAKMYHKNPVEIGQSVIEKLGDLKGVTVAFCPPAFINFSLTNEGFQNIANDLLMDKQRGVVKHSKSETVVFDYGGANVAKELHIGHLRSPIIGESLSRLHKLLGNKTISDVHLGDWGLQMGLTIAQLEDNGYLEGYFKRGQDKEITLDTLNEEYPKASKRKSIDEAFREKAEDYTLKIQNHRQPYFDIYKHIKQISIKEIKKNYEKLNANFDLWLGESDAQPFVEETVKIFTDKGLAYESENALIVDIATENENLPSGKFDENGKELLKNPMPPVIIKKSNGADIYATTELATILMRNREFNPDKIIYLTDLRQGQHFTQVFRAAKLAGISPESQKLVHIAFGTMTGQDGKPFKTRSGETVKLQDIIKLITDKAQEKLQQNGVQSDDDLALKIGVAAMKFGDLSSAVNKNYVFDLDKFTSFEGKTGPYIQYTAVRIKSILNKANFVAGKNIIIDLPEQRKIVMNILRFLDSLEIAYNENSLNSICLSLYNLCASFSNFYNNVRILTENDESRKNSYLSLCKLVLQTIEVGAYVLAFDIPEKM